LENSIEIPQQKLNWIPYYPAIPLVGLCPKGMQSVCPREVSQQARYGKTEVPINLLGNSYL
jgi:hypothetical protein